MVKMSAIIAAALLAACAPGSGAEEGTNAAGTGAAVNGAEGTTSAGVRHPVSGLQVIDLVVERGSQRLPFRVELAATAQDQARGLMFRPSLGPDEGMLFPSQVPEPRSFWMKNTPLSLDIIFVGADRRIINIAANTEPYSVKPVTSNGLTIAVLELRAGRAKELGIVPGDRVLWELP